MCSSVRRGHWIESSESESRQLWREGRVGDQKLSGFLSAHLHSEDPEMVLTACLTQ